MDAILLHSMNGKLTLISVPCLFTSRQVCCLQPWSLHVLKDKSEKTGICFNGLRVDLRIVYLDLDLDVIRLESNLVDTFHITG